MITLEGVDSRMIANNLTPFRPIHPGEILKDEIECRGIPQNKLARQMDMDYKMLNNILNGRRPLTTNSAILFEAALGVPADVLMRMQLDYNMQAAKKDEKLMSRFNEIRKIAAVLI